jgi:hypothetical protein
MPGASGQECPLHTIRPLTFLIDPSESYAARATTIASYSCWDWPGSSTHMV